MKFLILVLLFPVSGFATGGVDVGNGGDLVKCVPHSANELFGLYSLDYLVFSREPGKQPVNVQSWQESIFKIRRIFVDKLPELLPVFDDFANNILNEDHTRGQIWEPTDYALKELNDEELSISVKIPVNCRDGGKVQLVQAVIRQNPEFSGSKMIVYKYMPRVFEKMAAERPLQLSFLLVHEFLWSISDNVDRNRRINWFLHSEEIQTMSRLDIIDRLISMGLDVKSVPRILDAGGRGHFSSLQEAIQKSRDGETILIKEGTYSMAGSVITHSLNLIGDGKRGKTIIKGGYSDAALKVALEKGQTVRVENLMLSRMAEFDRKSYGRANTIEFGTPGNLIFRNVILRGEGEFQMNLGGAGNLDFENVVLEGTYGFLVDDYWGKTRLKDVTLIGDRRTGNDMWFNNGVPRKSSVEIISCRNQMAVYDLRKPDYPYDDLRIWEDWNVENPDSFLVPDPNCIPVTDVD